MKSVEVQVMMSRTRLPPSSLKPRWKSTYRPRTVSQNARFCESNAPLVITGSSRSKDQWVPSGDVNAYNPPSPPASALYRTSGAQPGFASLKGAKLWEPIPSQMMLFFLEPLNATSPRSGLVQRMPSLLSA